MKDPALRLYRHLTAGTRRRQFSVWQREQRVPVGILFYHRVADQHPNAWTLSCSDFAQQLDWLQANFDVVPLAEAQRRIQAVGNLRPTISITFDDGYADNAAFAIPELVRRGLSATYFVATNYVRSGQPFPHDVKAGQPLSPNSVTQLREFASQGIEIGAHTCSHADLGKISSGDELRSEILGSRDRLEAWLDRPVRYFAFPYGLPGNTSQSAVDIVRAAGLSGFCTAYGAWNWPANPGYHLRRIHADPGLEKLKNWLTYDPRKMVDRQVLPFSEPPRLSQIPVGSSLAAPLTYTPVSN